MRPPCHLQTFLISTLLSSTSHALTLNLPPTAPHPPPTLNLTTPSPNVPPLLNYTINCIPKTSAFTPCPEYFDCVQAVFKLPDWEGQGTFHNGEPDDPYRLPVWKTHRSCRVRVELVHEGSSRQSSNWQWIIARALNLNTDCITEQDIPRNAGAWTTMGRQDRILVVLEHNSVRDGVGANVTVS